jgi:hypothetical protein
VIFASENSHKFGQPEKIHNHSYGHTHVKSTISSSSSSKIITTTYCHSIANMTRTEATFKGLTKKAVQVKQDPSILSIPDLMRVATFRNEESDNGTLQAPVGRIVSPRTQQIEHAKRPLTALYLKNFIIIQIIIKLSSLGGEERILTHGGSSSDASTPQQA